MCIWHYCSYNAFVLPVCWIKTTKFMLEIGNQTYIISSLYGLLINVGCDFKMHLQTRGLLHKVFCAVKLPDTSNKSIPAARKTRSRIKHRHLKTWLFSLSLRQPQGSIQAETSHCTTNGRLRRNPVYMSFMSHVCRVCAHLLICVGLRVPVCPAEGEWVCIVLSPLSHFRLWAWPDPKGHCCCGLDEKIMIRTSWYWCATYFTGAAASLIKHWTTWMI